MQILDAGHIYLITHNSVSEERKLTFVKRSGGAVTYPVEWPGIQTQAVMRALIDFLSYSGDNTFETKRYALWQLGSDEYQTLLIDDLGTVADILEILIDRSNYLNSILKCAETSDACDWMHLAKAVTAYPNASEFIQREEMAYFVRMALWCYEARAYRRKQEEVNRKQPEHDDTARPRAWREFPCDDVPFNEIEIEIRPIGDDGHIIIENKELHNVF